jgi:hypothetical protein
MDQPCLSERVLPPIACAAAQLKSYFFNRTDRFAVLASWGTPCPATTADLDGLLLTHILGEQAPEVTIAYTFRDRTREERGRYRIGSYTPGPDNLTKWLCIDFDAGEDKSYPLADATAAMLETADRFEAVKIPCYAERSGGGQGWHLWAFFELPIPAEKARQLGLRLIPPGILLANGEPAEPRRHRGIERT